MYPWKQNKSLPQSNMSVLLNKLLMEGSGSLEKRGRGVQQPLPPLLGQRLSSGASEW